MKLSVISIAYNNLEGLKQTLSIFNATWLARGLELVIVDGGSNDGTREYLQSQTLCLNWVSEKDNGIYHAMNKGLSMAKGDYIWFLNSGDSVYDVETLSIVLNAIKDNADAYYGETLMVDPSGISIGTRSEISTRPLPKNLNWKSLRMGMNVSHQSFIVKRNLASVYDESIKYVSDIDWMIRTLKNCKKIVNLNCIIARFTQDGFSSKFRNQSNKERFWVLSKHYGFLPNLLAHVLILFRKLIGFKKY